MAYVRKQSSKATAKRPYELRYTLAASGYVVVRHCRNFGEAWRMKQRLPLGTDAKISFKGEVADVVETTVSR